MQDEPGMPFKPVYDLDSIVRAVVVHHQMQMNLSRELMIYAIQKPQKLLVSMALVALADHFTLKEFDRGKHRRQV